MIRHAIFAAMLISCPPCLCQDALVNCRGPLTSEAMARLVADKVVEARLRKIVSTCGIEFTLTSESEAKLKQSGASDQLVIFLRAQPALLPGATRENGRDGLTYVYV